MASTYLSRTFSTPTSSQIFTFSFWVKKSQGSQSDDMHIFNNYVSGTSRLTCAIDGNENFKIENNNGSYNLRFITDAEYRDVNGFYHFVISVDTTQSTESNRVKIYVNGVQETSFSTATYPSQNDNIKVPDASHTMYIGTFTGSAQFWDGIMTHVHFIDGTAYDATAFGEFDANGVWKAKTSPSVTYGTNGFFILKDSASVTDQSGNGNNFTVGGGTLTDTLDCPANVFATLNPLNIPTSNAPTFSNGNLKTVCGTTGGAYMGSATMGVSSGKYYSEMKVKTVDSVIAGISANASEDARDNVYPGQQGDSVGILLSNGQKYINDSGSTHGSSLSANDILMIALDLDNNNVYFGKNGQWFDGSGNANQSSPSSAISITAPSSTTDGFYFFSVGDGGGSQAGDVEWNFGNGYFGTTAVASAGTNASGIGIFEYDVPTGYTALSTKGLNL
jgi:hypothetical protein